MEGTIYKIGVNVPEASMRAVMEAVGDIVRPIYLGYDHVFCWWPVTGTWRPLEGSDPYLGRIGEPETAPEMRLEFAVTEDDLEAAVSAVADSHPYEEPSIDVIPMIPWKSVIGRDGSCRDCRRSSASCGS